MTQETATLLIYLVVFLSLVPSLLILFKYSRKANKEYWRGRLEGWKACEDMVLKRAEEDENYNRKDVWEDLLQ
jgi:hypothetical protein